MTQKWGAAVETLVAELGDPFVLGITAAPVTDPERPLGRLLASPDHTISLPSVVRHGHLAPYQDLCQLAAPTAGEEEEVDAALGTFERLFTELCRAAPNRFSLPHWADELELAPVSADGRP